MIQSYLPKGVLFKNIQGNKLDKLLDIYNDADRELADFARSNIADLDPSKTENYIYEWARLLNITNEITALEPDKVLQRALILERLTGDEIKTIEYFIQKADALGYTIRLREHRTITAGESVAGDFCTHEREWIYPENVFVFFVEGVYDFEYPVAGEAVAGDVMSPYGVRELEEAILLEFPSNMLPVFEYNVEFFGFKSTVQFHEWGGL
jgi:uncharacterized protein YmfQ (DUF2313 family)